MQKKIIKVKHLFIFLLSLILLYSVSLDAVSYKKKMHNSIKHNDVSQLEKIITEKLIDINKFFKFKKFDNKLTLLQLAAIYGQAEIITFLVKTLNAKVDLAHKDYMCTALHYACINNKLDVVKLLIEQLGANIDGVSVQEETPLLKTCRYHDCLSVFKYLVNSGAEINVHGHNSVFYNAILNHTNKYQTIELLKFIINSGHNMDIAAQELVGTLVTAEEIDKNMPGSSICFVIKTARKLTLYLKKGKINEAWNLLNKHSNEPCLVNCVLFMLNQDNFGKFVKIRNEAKKTNYSASDFLEELLPYAAPPLIFHLLKTGILPPNNTKFISKFPVNTKHPVYQLRMLKASWQTETFPSDLNLIFKSKY